ncbi:aec71 [Escherichia coli DEC10B]|nr:aec71 [Escherichia coli DEC10B]
MFRTGEMWWTESVEGAYEVVGVFDRIEEKRDAMQSLILPPPARQALAQAALTYRYGDEHQPVTNRRHSDATTPGGLR